MRFGATVSVLAQNPPYNGSASCSVQKCTIAPTCPNTPFCLPLCTIKCNNSKSEHSDSKCHFAKYDLGLNEIIFAMSFSNDTGIILPVQWLVKVFNTLESYHHFLFYKRYLHLFSQSAFSFWTLMLKYMSKG